MVTDSTGRRVRTALGTVLVAAGTAATMAFGSGTAAALPEPNGSSGSVTVGLPDLLTSVLDQFGFGSLGSSSIGSSGSLGSSNTGSFGSSYGSVVDSPSA